MSAFVCLLFFAILFLLVFCRTKTTENYGFVMGTTGTRKNEYYNCISKCEREDLSKKLGPTHGNLFCAEFCDSKMTDAVRYNKPEPIIATRFDYYVELKTKELFAGKIVTVLQRLTKNAE